MDEKQIKDLFRTELKSVVDEAIEKNISEIAGKEVSAQVKEIVAKMRLDRATYGSDKSGLSDEVSISLNANLDYLGGGMLWVASLCVGNSIKIKRLS